MSSIAIAISTAAVAVTIANLNAVANFTRRKSNHKQYFITDNTMDGEYFRSKTKNQYFCLVDKNVKLGDVHNHIHDFRELEEAVKNYDPENHRILRLEFTKNKKYFAVGSQAIEMCWEGVKEKPDVTIMNMSLEELRNITPKFEPLP